MAQNIRASDITSTGLAWNGPAWPGLATIWLEIGCNQSDKKCDNDQLINIFKVRAISGFSLTSLVLAG